jgi:nucleoside-triphosphatase THEP1
MITIVTGDINAYKTTYVEHLMIGRTQADGILSKKRFCGDRFDGYDVQHVSSGLRANFLSLSTPSHAKIGGFYVQEEGLEWAKALIRKAIDERKLVVIDELGQAELFGRAFYEELMLVFDEEADALLVIRKRLLDQFQEKFPQLAEARIIEVSEYEKRYR